LRLISVTAPTGFGKSTFVAQWMRGLEDPQLIRAWISLDDAITSPVMLAYSIADALLPHFPMLADAQSELRAGRLTAEQFVAPLLMQIERAAGPVACVLDDYHLVVEKAAHEFVQHVLDHAPANLHLVLLSRTQPPLRMSRLLLDDAAVAFNERHLRFDHEEFDDFVRSSRLASLSEAQRTAVELLAEGWAAALRLIDLSLIEDTAGAPKGPLFGARTGRLLIEHLEAEVFRHLPTDLQEFLIDAAELPFLDPALAATALNLDMAVCDTLIQRIVEGNLFVTAHGEQERIRHRLHPLFRDLLTRQATQRDAARTAGIRRRAAHWLAAHDEVDAGLALLLPSQQEDAANLLCACLRPALLAFDLTDARRWLTQLSATTIDAHPQLAIDAAWLWFFAEESDDGHAVARAQAVIAAHPHACTEEIRAEMAVLSAIALIVQGRTSDAVDAVRDAATASCVAAGLAAGYRHVLPALLPQRPDDFLVQLRCAEEIFRRIGFTHGVIETALMQCVLIQRMGDAAGATAMFERTLAILHYFDREHSADAVETHFYFGDHLYGLNRLSEARDQFEHAVAAGERLSMHWANAYHARIGLQMCDLSAGMTPANFDPHADALHWTRVYQSTPPAVCFRIAWLRMLRDARMGFPERCRQTAAEFGVTPAELDSRMHEMVWLVVLAGAVLGRTSDEAADARLREFIVHLRDDGNLWMAARAEMLLALRLLESGDAAGARDAASLLIARNDCPRLILDFPALAELLDTTDSTSLTNSEQRILHMLNSDMVNKEIAYALSISIHTLYTHLRSIYRKLGVHSRAEAVRVARAVGLGTA